jgi:hypothetical protein
MVVFLCLFYLYIIIIFCYIFWQNVRAIEAMSYIIISIQLAFYNSIILLLYYIIKEKKRIIIIVIVE